MTVSNVLEAAVAVEPTDLGWLALAVRGRKLLAMVYGFPSATKAERKLYHELETIAEDTPSKASDGSLATEWAELVANYCRGEPTPLDRIVLADERLTPFARQVTQRCREIPSGGTMTYGELAAACGRPRAARAVGSVMARNPWPLVTPCHRVVAACGRLGGYSAPQGLAMKRRLLAMEGVAVKPLQGSSTRVPS